MCHVSSVSAGISSSLAIYYLHQPIIQQTYVYWYVVSTRGCYNYAVSSRYAAYTRCCIYCSIAANFKYPIGTLGFVPPRFVYPSMINAIPNIYGLNGYPYMSVSPGFGGIPFPVPPYQYNHLQHLLPTHQPGSMNLSQLTMPSALSQPVYSCLNSMQPTQSVAGSINCPQH